jgi:hypothetical protein
VARLRVGDIEIDGNQVRIGGREMTPAQPADKAPVHPGSTALVRSSGTALASRQSTSLAPKPETPQTLARLPGSDGLWMGGGLALAVLGLCAFVLGGSFDIVSYFFHGGILIPMGLGLAYMGYLKRVGHRTLQAEAQARDDAELGEPMQRIRGLLEAPPEREPTIEKVAARLGLPEATVVRALVRLRDRGEVKEELGLDTGEWFYVLVPPGEEGPRDLDARLAKLERSNRS